MGMILGKPGVLSFKSSSSLSLFLSVTLLQAHHQSLHFLFPLLQPLLLPDAITVYVNEQDAILVLHQQILCANLAMTCTW